MDNITVPAGQIRKMTNALMGLSDNAEIGFEFIMTALFPTVFNNIQEEIKKQYTLGYIQGKKDIEDETKEHSI